MYHTLCTTKYTHTKLHNSMKYFKMILRETRAHQKCIVHHIGLL